MTRRIHEIVANLFGIVFGIFSIVGLTVQAIIYSTEITPVRVLFMGLLAVGMYWMSSSTILDLLTKEEP